MTSKLHCELSSLVKLELQFWNFPSIAASGLRDEPSKISPSNPAKVVIHKALRLVSYCVLSGKPFMFPKVFTQRALSGLAIVSCLIAAGLPAVSVAQGLPGLTLFGGVKGEDNLNYRLDFGGRAGGWDRYRLRIPAKKMKLAVAQFAISYPNYFRGEFDTKDIEILVKDKAVKLQEVRWNKEDNLLEIFPAEPVPAGSSVEIQLSNVRNPDSGGMFYFNCQILSPGDVPLLRYLGTWVISIS